MKIFIIIIVSVVALCTSKIEAQISAPAPSAPSGGSSSTLTKGVISAPTGPGKPTGIKDPANAPNLELLRKQAEGLQSLTGTDPQGLKGTAPGDTSEGGSAPNLPSGRLKELGVGSIELNQGSGPKWITKTVPNPDADEREVPVNREDFELLKTLDETTIEALLNRKVPEVEEPSAFKEPEDEASELQALPTEERIGRNREPDTGIGSNAGFNEGVSGKIGGQRDSVSEDGGTDIPGTEEVIVYLGNEKYVVVIFDLGAGRDHYNDPSLKPGDQFYDDSDKGIYGVAIVSDGASDEERSRASLANAGLQAALMSTPYKEEESGIDPVVVEPAWYEEGGSVIGDFFAWVWGLFSDDDDKPADDSTDPSVIVGEDEPAGENPDGQVIVDDEESAGDNPDGQVILDDEEEEDDDEPDEEEDPEEEGDDTRGSFTGNDNDDGGGKSGPLTPNRFPGGQQGGIGGGGNDGDTIRMGESEGKGGPLVATPETGNPTIRFNSEEIEAGELNPARLKELLENGAIDFNEDGDPRDQPKPAVGGEGTAPINGGNPGINLQKSAGVKLETEDLDVEVEVEADLSEKIEAIERLESN